MDENIVFAKQNEKDSIDKLMAVRRLYSNAKFINKVNFIFSVIIPVILSLVKVFISKCDFVFNQSFVPYLGYYGIAVLVFTVMTNGIVSDLKKKAAKIQEMFDCDVLSIKWNDVKLGKKINSLNILKASRYYRKRKKEPVFKNWYFDKEYAFNKNISTLLCQNENIGWDLSQRIILNRLIMITLVFSGSFLLGFCFYYDMKVSEFLFYIVFLLPFFRHFYLLFKDNNSTIDRCSRVNENIDKTIELCISGDEKDNLSLDYTIRTIQDEIYTHRVSSQPVPDIIHKIFRSRNEEQFKQHFEYYLDKMKNP